MYQQNQSSSIKFLVLGLLGVFLIGGAIIGVVFALVNGGKTDTDSENDIPMLKAAGLGIAMQNADAKVQAAADRVTLSNNENGIVAALKMILEESNDIR